MAPSAQKVSRSGQLTQHIPLLLREQPRWCRWHVARTDDGGWTKVPNGSTRDPRMWRPWAEVQNVQRTAEGGIGFVLTGGVAVAGGMLLALDLDACRDRGTGELTEWAEAVLAACGQTFTEVTVSGTGLRVWIVVREMPVRWPKVVIPVAAPAAEGARKDPEIQFFGYGKAGYVTVSGQHLPGTKKDVEVVDNLGWFWQAFGVGEGGGGEELVELPRGLGGAPSDLEIETAIRRMPHGDEFVSGNWHAMWNGDPLAEGEKRSASEAYWRGVQMVVRAARGHGDAAVQFLLHHTAWGRGEIEDSKDASRYEREDWVRGEVLRVAGKTGVAEAASGEAFPEIAPAALPAAQVSIPAQNDTGALLIPAGDFVRSAGKQMFLVKNLVARTGLTQWFGDPASGKTPMVMSLALAIASGAETWFGRKVMRHGLVVYMVGEDRAGVAHRLAAECQVRGISPEALSGRLVFTARPGQLLDAADASLWVRTIREVAAGREVAAVCCDTQAQNFGAGDENDFRDLNRFIHNTKAISESLETAVQLVHHTGHQNKDRGRGHSAMDAALESRFEVTCNEGDDGEKTVTAQDHKHKNWARPAPLKGTLVPVVRYVDEDGDEVTAITLREGDVSAFTAPTARQRELLLAVSEGVDTERKLGEKLTISRWQARKLVAQEMAAGRVSRNKLDAVTWAYSLTDLGFASLAAKCLPLGGGILDSELPAAQGRSASAQGRPGLLD